MGLIPNGGEDGYELSCAQEHNKHNMHNSTSLENTSHRESKEFIKLCN